MGNCGAGRAGGGGQGGKRGVLRGGDWFCRLGARGGGLLCTHGTAQRGLIDSPQGFDKMLWPWCKSQEDGAQGAGMGSTGSRRKRGEKKYIKEGEMNNCRQSTDSGLPPPFSNLTP